MSADLPGPPLIGALMRIPVDAIHARMIEGVNAAGFDDVVPAHLAVLRYPGPSGRRPSELAEDARMSKQAVNYLLGELERLGYLVRTDDPDDRRSKRIELTRRGVDLQRAIRGVVGEIEAELEEQLGAKRFAQLRRLLQDLNATAFVQGPP